MSKQNDPQSQSVLDDVTIELLGSTPVAVDLPPDRMRTLRARVMQRIADEQRVPEEPFVTMRADQGAWIQIAAKIEKKVLHVDHETGTESYLLRVQPGAEAPEHVHHEDELCLILEGEITIGNLCLRAGDCHLARKGSRHGIARCETGALVFMQGALHHHAG